MHGMRIKSHKNAGFHQQQTKQRFHTPVYWNSHAPYQNNVIPFPSNQSTEQSSGQSHGLAEDSDSSTSKTTVKRKKSASKKASNSAKKRK